MIYLIQSYLKGILTGCTDIPANAACLNLDEAMRYTSAPFASILPQTLSLSPLWQWDSAVKEPGKAVKIRCKYQALLPIEVLIRAKTQSEAAQYLQYFLQALPRTATIDNTRVALSPSAANPVLGEGTLDLNAYTLIINCRYGIYESLETPLIKGVEINVKQPLR